MDWTPESSRRARGFAVYAALRALGRSGVERSRRSLLPAGAPLCRSVAARSRGFEILNEVVLNQVLVRVEPGSGDADARDA